MVHRHESLSRLHIGRKKAIPGKAARQAPRQEDWVADAMEMGQPTFVADGHRKESGLESNSLSLALWGRMASCAPVANRRLPDMFAEGGRRVTNPPQVNNLPHTTELGVHHD